MKFETYAHEIVIILKIRAKQHPHWSYMHILAMKCAPARLRLVRAHLCTDLYENLVDG